MVKPETIRVGVQGFVAFEAKPSAPAHHIDWERIAGLPAFGMFMAERYPSKRADPSAALYAEYCDWHAAKGYWPSETADGRLVSVSA